MNPTTDIAKQIRQFHEALVAEGFTEAQAMTLVSKWLVAIVQKPADTPVAPLAQFGKAAPS